MVPIGTSTNPWRRTMSNATVLVTGAAGGTQGQTGRHVSEMLLAKGASVRAFVRKLDARAEHLRSLGAELVEGDFLDYHSVERALQGVSTVYFAYPVQAGLVDAGPANGHAPRAGGGPPPRDRGDAVPLAEAPTPRR